MSNLGLKCTKFDLCPLVCLSVQFSANNWTNGRGRFSDIWSLTLCYKVSDIYGLKLHA